MKADDEDKIHALALELHESVSRANRAALRKYPDGRDDGAERGRDLREAVIDELEWRLLEVAADLFDLSGDPDSAEEVRETIEDAQRTTAAARRSSRICQGCGCTDFLACPGGCSWAGDQTCSRCKGKPRRPSSARARR